MAPFVQILTGAELIAAFGDEHTAVAMYDTETVPVKSAPAAECVTVDGGQVTRSRFIFDRAPFEAARRETGQGSASLPCARLAPPRDDPLRLR